MRKDESIRANQAPKDKKISRRRFLRGLGEVAFVAGVAATIGPEKKPAQQPENPKPASQSFEPAPATQSEVGYNKEQEPLSQTIPTMIGFTNYMESVNESDGSLITLDSTLPSYITSFDRLADHSLADLKTEFDKDEKNAGRDFENAATAYMFEQGHIKDGVVATLLQVLAQRGVQNINLMRQVREYANGQQAQPENQQDDVPLEFLTWDDDKKQAFTEELERKRALATENIESLPLDPIPTISVQENLLFFKQSEDEHGNAIYELTIPEDTLTDMIRQSSTAVVNVGMLPKMHIRAATKWPQGEELRYQDGWTEGKYSGGNYDTQNDTEKLITYDEPALQTLDTVNDPEVQEILKRLGEQFPDKVLVFPTSDSPATYESIKLPPNVILVGSYDVRANREGSYYGIVDPQETFFVSQERLTSENTSTASASLVAEWLSEQKGYKPSEVKQLLTSRSRVDNSTGNRLLDIGSVPDLAGTDIWNNPERFSNNTIATPEIP